MPIIPDGTYIIYNVPTKTIVGRDRNNLVASSEEEDDEIDLKWLIAHVTEDLYTIQTQNSTFANFQELPRQEYQVNATQDSHWWEIKAAENSRHFTIGLIGQELYWGVINVAHRAPIMLNDNPMNDKNHWIVARRPSRMKTLAPLWDISMSLESIHSELIACFESCDKAVAYISQCTNLIAKADNIFRSLNDSELEKQRQGLDGLDGAKRGVIFSSFRSVNALIGSLDSSQPPLKYEKFSNSLKEVYEQLNKCCEMLGLHHIIHDMSLLLAQAEVAPVATLSSAHQANMSPLNGKSHLRIFDSKQFTSVDVSDMTVSASIQTAQPSKCSWKTNKFFSFEVAPSLGTLNPEEEWLDDELKAIVLNDMEAMGSILAQDRDWKSILRLFNSNSKLQQEGEEASTCLRYSKKSMVLASLGAYGR
ncbi:hypothetical protein FRC02_010766 [Tulasnella sp. 418]|nr:hypothetical protein FRC02_010766 [Tulasnella sp. 418]